MLIALWIINAVLALLFLTSGLTKVTRTSDRLVAAGYWGTHTFLRGDLALQQDEYPLVDYFDSAGVWLKC